MRNLIAGVLVTAAAVLVAGHGMAADLYVPPPVVAPPVDNGLGGAFYLRASVGGNMLWSHDHIFSQGSGSDTPTGAGYGYSFGAGFGYEAGNGLRADVTLDQLNNDGLTDGIDSLHLRSTIALANAYYDFPIGGFGQGGFGAYVGAGIGGAYYKVSSTGSSTLPDGEGWTAAGAAMAGITYDAGSYVADLGYRAIYLPQLSNNATYPNSSYYLNQNLIQEVRGTLRYRIN